MSDPALKLLLHGHDTVECAYYLKAEAGSDLDFERLTCERDRQRDEKRPEGRPVGLAGMDFLLKPHGTKSGYPLVLTNRDFTVALGEFNTPSFFVKFSSEALWREGAQGLHQRFTAWAERAGLVATRPESLSRVDFTFDYSLPGLDFDEDSFVSLSSKDSLHRAERKRQTFSFGTTPVRLRVYDKIAEIHGQSGKVWFFPLWGQDSGVWRIEWQVRKALLKRFGLRSFADLDDQQGDLLTYLASEHDTLRCRTGDGNRSRWPLHPLWQDLQAQISRLGRQGVYAEIEPAALIEERLARLGVSLYGNLKMLAALRCALEERRMMQPPEAMTALQDMIGRLHDPLVWHADVNKRLNRVRFGQC